MSLIDDIRAASNGEEKWALLYIMVSYTDGTHGTMHSVEPAAGKTIEAVWPQVHGFYDTWQEAEAMRASKLYHGGYFVRSMRNYTGTRI